MTPKLPLFLVILLSQIGSLAAAPPLPLSSDYWKDPAFQRSFNGSYQIEARIEPTVSTAERGLLVGVQELMQKGQRTNALNKIKDSSLTKDSAALLFNLGNLHYESGDDEAATLSYQAALKIYPSFRRAHRNLAASFMRQGKTDEALPPLLEAIRLGDSDGMTYGLLGYARLARQEWASALQAYRLAQLTEPAVPDWKAGTAQCLEQLDQDQEALALLDEVIQIRPAVPSYAILQASIYLKKGQETEAIKSLELPRRLGTLNADGLADLADLYLQKSDLSEVRALVAEATAEDKDPPLPPTRLLALTSSAMAYQHWALAQELLTQAKTENLPENLTKRLEGQLLISSAENPAQGATLLREVLKENPTDGACLLALGKFHLSENDPAHAALLFQRATLDPDHAISAFIQIAQLYAAQQNFPKALEAADQALALRSDSNLEDYRNQLAHLVEATQ